MTINVTLDEPAREALTVAPVDMALSFARVMEEGGPHLLLVTDYGRNRVTGIDLTALLGSDVNDPIKAYMHFGYDGLATLRERDPRRTVPLTRLILPVDLTGSHIAVGTNFPEHANESSVKDGPFLFPKEVVPTPFNATVAATDALLDYEVELCFVALSDISLDVAPARAGLILCNDFTDRAKLLRHVDVKDITSGKGFTMGKSAPGYLPMGSLFVIPHDLRDFVENIELRLYRNGVLKQSARQTEAIWDFDELLRQAKLRERTRWEFLGSEVGLAIVDGQIPARTAFLAGTPEGTIFQGPHASAIMRGLIDWVTSGFSRSLIHFIVERQIIKDKKERRYLQQGERIDIEVTFMGELRNEIVA